MSGRKNTSGQKFLILEARPITTTMSSRMKRRGIGHPNFKDDDEQLSVGDGLEKCEATK